MHPKRLLSTSIYVIVLLYFVLAASCAEKREKPIRLLAIQGDSEVSSSKFLWRNFKAPDSTGFVHIPVQDGDLIFGDGFIFSLWEGFPDSIIVDPQDSMVFVNGELWGIDFSESQNRSIFLDSIRDFDFNHLRNLGLVFPMDTTQKNFLGNIKGNQHQIDIVITNKDTLGLFNEDLKWLAANFQISTLIIDQVPDSLDFHVIRSIKTLDFLGLGNIPISLQTGILPQLPQIKSLSLGAEEPLNFDFFYNNKQLERLIAGYVVGAEIHVLKNLKELSIIVPSEYFPPYYDFAKRHPNLESLDFPSNWISDFSHLKGLEKLKWFSFQYSGDSLGLDLEELVETHPQLKLLSISHEGFRSRLANQSALRNFSQLEYLLIQKETFGIDSVIMQMPHLKYLSMPEDYLEDSLNLEAMKKALPNTIISANSGFCLGSGWLLLLLPLSLLAFLIQRLFFQVSLGKSEP
jgi:hypothetical protein